MMFEIFQVRITEPEVYRGLFHVLLIPCSAQAGLTGTASTRLHGTFAQERRISLGVSPSFLEHQKCEHDGFSLVGCARKLL